MKIRIRTLKQERYEFEVDENDTLDKLKTLIFERLGHEKSHQNLIFSGAMLDSARTIASYKITEKDFLVLLVKKPKEVPTGTKDTKTPTQPSKPQVTQPAQPAVQPTQQPQQPLQENQPSQFTQLPPQVEMVVKGLMEMGFERNQVELALMNCNFNPDRAAELLSMGGVLPGMGSGMEDFLRDFGTSSDFGDLGDDIGDEDLGDMGDDDGDMDDMAEEDLDEEDEEMDSGEILDYIHNHPSFNTLRLMARTNPDRLGQIINQLPQEIATVIANHPDEFLNFLSEEPGTSIPSGGIAGPPVGQPLPQVTLSPQEEAVINNLVDMGFDRNRVREAYLLFEKDIDMTANYLLNHGFDGV